jgi:hypothetical protein
MTTGASALTMVVTMRTSLPFDDTELTSESASTDFLEGFISEPEYARQRGVTLRTCQRDRQLRKAPPHTKLGRQIYYRVDAVREWLMKNERIADRTPDARRSRSFRNSCQLPRGKRQQPQTDPG